MIMKNILLLLFLMVSLNAASQNDNYTIKKINKTIRLINTQYVDTVNMPHLVEVAVKAMINELDPHSKYLTKEQLKKNNEALNGSFAGVGIHYQILNDTLLILSTTEGGPSEKAGLKAGDKVVKIDGTSAVGKSITNSFFSRKLRGTKGSAVQLEIRRRDVDSILTFTVTRGSIPIPTVDAAFMLDRHIGYVKINGFSFTTHKEFKTVTAQLKSEGMKSLILDLRGNPGGLMMASIRIADEFLEESQLIVYTEGEHYKRQDYKSTKSGSLKNEKLIILVDEFSASASEILAGAIQDLDRGIIAGRRSYGKGLVGRNYTLPDGSAVRLTTGHYYTPTGRCIQKPYSGDNSEYKKDLQTRLNNGEYLHADSIHFPDSLKYKTPKGRTVYGGGGIMPDVFYPMDTVTFPDYYNKLFTRGIINAYAGQYFDSHLNDLFIKYPDVRSFEKEFRVTDDILLQISVFAKEKYGLEKDSLSYQRYGERIARYFKAYLGRDLYEHGAYYLLISHSDPMIMKSVQLLNVKKSFRIIER